MPKPGVDPSSGISLGDVLRLPKRIRHVGGAKLNLALVRNVRTWPVMPREKAQAVSTARPKVPMRRRGADCSVIAVKRGNARGAKGAGHRLWIGLTGNGRSLIISGRRRRFRYASSWVFHQAPGSDSTARLIGQWLTERLGQTFIVENRPGANANTTLA